MVDQPAGADLLLAKTTLDFCGVQQGVKEMHTWGVILLNGGTREHLNPVGFRLMGSQAHGWELVVAELASEHLVLRCSVLRQLQLAGEDFLALVTLDFSVCCSHVVLQLSDIFKDCVAGETIRRRVADDSMDERGVLVVKPLVAVLAFCCSFNCLVGAVLLPKLFNDLHLDLGDHWSVALLKLHDRLKDVTLGARVSLVLVFVALGAEVVLVLLQHVAPAAEVVRVLRVQVSLEVGHLPNNFSTHLLIVAKKVTLSEHKGQDAWVSPFPRAACFVFPLLVFPAALVPPLPVFCFRSIISSAFVATYVE